jgi:hypothetical protein
VEPTRGLPPYRLRLVHVTALWAYAVAQPFLSLFKGNPDVLIAHELMRRDAVFVAALVVVGPPVLLVSYSWLVGRLSRFASDVLYLAVLGACLVPLGLQLAKFVEPSRLIALLIVAIVTVGGVVVYVGLRAARLFLQFSIVLPLIGFLAFALGLPSLTPSVQAASVTVGSPHPVVVLVLDELPLSSLLTETGRIDAVRYPNFGRLAADATWYQNATTVAPATRGAVPAILTGKMLTPGRLPIAADHPENLFTLLGGPYRLHVLETATRLCPVEYCGPRLGSLGKRLGPLLADLRNLYFRRIIPRSIQFDYMRSSAGNVVGRWDATRSTSEFERFLAEISPATSPRSLHYAHLFIPHEPWLFLPSGARYEHETLDAWAYQGERWVDDPWPVLQGLQAHLLQVEYTDLLVGRLLSRLDKVGLYDRALVVVIVDHGASFRAGGYRRSVTNENIADVSSVPLFVKYPGQRRGRVDVRPAWTVDVLPTIVDVLEVKLPWRVAGASLLGPPPARAQVVVTALNGEAYRAPLERVIREREAVVQRKVAAFGEGSDSLFAIGANTWLLGRSIGDVRQSPAVRVHVDDERDLANVHKASSFVPARIAGLVERGRIEDGTELALAVNGRVRALTRVFEVNGKQYFRALVPELSFREGYNRVDVYAVRATSKPELVWLGGGPDRE